MHTHKVTPTVLQNTCMYKCHVSEVMCTMLPAPSKHSSHGYPEELDTSCSGLNLSQWTATQPLKRPPWSATSRRWVGSFFMNSCLPWLRLHTRIVRSLEPVAMRQPLVSLPGSATITKSSQQGNKPWLWNMKQAAVSESITININSGNKTFKHYVMW